MTIERWVSRDSCEPFSREEQSDYSHALLKARSGIGSDDLAVMTLSTHAGQRVDLRRLILHFLLEVGWFETRVFGDTSQHPGTNFCSVVKSKDVVTPAFTLKNAV